MSRMRGASIGLKHTLTTKTGAMQSIIASSVSLLIQCMALKITNIKSDSYINLDVATLSPTE